MQLDKIEACLTGKILTTGQFYNPDLNCRCAVGQILSCQGVSNSALLQLDDSSEPILAAWARYSDQLRSVGINSYADLLDLITLNDNWDIDEDRIVNETCSQFLIRRLKELFGGEMN